MTIPSPKTIAVMQPYFLPYAGYFRLFAASDLFVIYDCVQFPRRGWVHRNRLIDGVGGTSWLTLRLAKAPRDALIKDLRFAQGAGDSLSRDLLRFPSVAALRPDAQGIELALRSVTGTPVDYVERLLNRVTEYLSLPFNVIRSSTLDISSSLTGQQRVLEIVKRVGGTDYVNAPSGRDLYDEPTFRSEGVALHFLPEYAGSNLSILSRVATESPEAIRAEIIEAL